MTIQINKNLDNYKEKIVFGLTAKQFIHVLIVGGICVSLCLLLHRFIGIMAAACLCFPIAAPIALNGFYEWNGLSFGESMKLRIAYMLNNRPIKYDSESESEALITKIRNAEDAAIKAKEKKDKRKSKFGIPGINLFKKRDKKKNKKEDKKAA